MRRDPRIIAHEAGHAAVGLLLGIEVSSIVLTPHARTMSGYVMHTEVDKAQWLHDAIMSAAGPAADVILGAKLDLRRPSVAWGFDLQAIRSYGYSTAEQELLIRIAGQWLLTPTGTKLWQSRQEILHERDVTPADIAELHEGAPVGRLLA